MKNERLPKNYSKYSNSRIHNSNSSLPILNLPTRETSSIEKTIKVNKGNKSIYSNTNIYQLIANKKKESKIKLKGLKITSSSISLTKNPKTASEDHSIKKKINKIFLKQSLINIKPILNDQTKTNINKPIIIRGLSSSKSNQLKNDNGKDGHKTQVFIQQSKLKAVNNNKDKNNFKKKYRLQPVDLMDILTINEMKGLRNNSNTSTNTKDSPCVNKTAKKYRTTLSLNIPTKTNNINNNHGNDSNKHDDINPHRQQEEEEGIPIKEYAYKENANLKNRKAMEDFHYINQNIHLDNNKHFAIFAIFDGHNGSSAAIYCQKNFERLLKRFLTEMEAKIEDSLYKTFIELDEEIKAAKPYIIKSGTTATVAVFYNNTLYCANVGDSSCFIFQQDNCIKMTEDHNLKDSNEVKRIKERGGLVFNDRVFGSLNLTRVIGDIEMKAYGVLAEPSIHTKTLNDKDKYVILASDGVWNYCNEHEILSLINKLNDKSAPSLSDKIVSFSLENGSLDNISCIVIKL